MRSLILFFTLLLSLHALDATMKIEKDVDQRAKVAIVDESSSLEPELREKVFGILRNDMKITGHFLPLEKHFEGSGAGGFLDPSLRSVEYLLKYRMKTPSEGGAVLEIRLLKGSDSALVMEKSYSIRSLERYPFLLHRAVTEINARLAYTPVDWLNRYLLFAKYTGKGKSEVGVADYTFHYVKSIIKGGLNLFPIWGDNEQKSIYFTSYDGNLPTLKRLDLSTGELTRLMDSQGMLVCSDLSKDGQRLLLTMAPQGQPDIYEYTVATGELRRLTTFQGIDVGGKYADEDQTLVFVSNRLGHPNIFKKPIQGGPITPLVFHGSNNDSCDAFDNKVVYSSRESDNSFGKKAFNLYLTTTDSAYVRPLTAGGINQFPRFSSDGNTVLYIKRSREGNFLGYLGLASNVSILFPLGIQRLQSIDW